MASFQLTYCLNEVASLLEDMINDAKSKHHHPRARALLLEVKAHRDRQLSAMAAASATRAKRTPTGGGGRPPSCYIVDLEPGPEFIVWGVASAAAKVNALAAANGEAWTVGAGAINVALARAGVWWRVLATDNGEVTLTVKKASPTREAAERARQLELGTEIAEEQGLCQNTETDEEAN